MAKILAFVSGKGGSGTTTVAVNVASALSKRCNRVLFMDLNVGFGGAETLLGVQNKVIYHIVDVVEGNCKIIDALIPIPEHAGFYLLAARGHRGFKEIPAETLKKLVGLFSPRFDYVILDVPSGFSPYFRTAVSLSDSVLFVSEGKCAAASPNAELYAWLNEDMKKKCAVVLNRIRTDLLKEEETETPEEVLEALKIPLIGLLPEDDGIYLLARPGRPMTENRALPWREFLNIAKRIEGEEVAFSLK